MNLWSTITCCVLVTAVASVPYSCMNTLNNEKDNAAKVEIEREKTLQMRYHDSLDFILNMKAK